MYSEKTSECACRCGGSCVVFKPLRRQSCPRARPQVPAATSLRGFRHTFGRYLQDQVGTRALCSAWCCTFVLVVRVEDDARVSSRQQMCTSISQSRLSASSMQYARADAEHARLVSSQHCAQRAISLVFAVSVSAGFTRSEGIDLSARRSDMLNFTGFAIWWLTCQALPETHFDNRLNPGEPTAINVCWGIT